MKIKINYLQIYSIISLILYFIYIIFFTLLYYKNGNISALAEFFYLCLIPFLISLIVLLIGNYTNKKYPKITKIMANIINLSVIFIHFYYMFMFYMIISAFSSLDNTEYTKIEDYQKALTSYKTEAVNHFPREVPKNAKNISMLRTPDSFTGDSTFYLKFDTNKNYIKSEIEYYKDKCKIFKTNKIKNSSTDTKYNYEETDAVSQLDFITNYDGKDWTIYRIERDSCFKGIATNDNTIIYILSCD